jgi:hypothetical protein
LAFLTDTQDEGSIRRIHIQAYDIDQFLDESLVPDQLEDLGQMRLKVVLAPNPTNAGFTDFLRPGHASATAMRGIWRL